MAKDGQLLLEYAEAVSANNRALGRLYVGGVLIVALGGILSYWSLRT